VPALGIDASHGAHHLRAEEDVVGGNDREQQIDSPLVVDARVEEHVVADEIRWPRALHVLREPAVSPPVIWDGPAAVRDDHAQRRKVLEQIGGEELHESRGVCVDVVSARRVEVRVARRAHVDHRRHVELDELLVKGIPAPIRERRRRPAAAGRIGIEIAADEPEFVDAAFQFGDAIRQRVARRLRQLAHADEVRGKKSAHAVDQIVAVARPGKAGSRVADVVCHRRRARRKDRDVSATIALEFQLRLDALPKLIVGDRERTCGNGDGGVLQRGDLRVAKSLKLFRRGGVVPVAVDNHQPGSYQPGLGEQDPAYAVCVRVT
jgi:hypothetical protein